VTIKNNEYIDYGFYPLKKYERALKPPNGTLMVLSVINTMVTSFGAAILVLFRWEYTNSNNPDRRCCYLLLNKGG
jgi:hypothetical protein